MSGNFEVSVPKAETTTSSKSSDDGDSSGVTLSLNANGAQVIPITEPTTKTTSQEKEDNPREDSPITPKQSPLEQKRESVSSTATPQPPSTPTRASSSSVKIPSPPPTNVMASSSSSVKTTPPTSAIAKTPPPAKLQTEQREVTPVSLEPEPATPPERHATPPPSEGGGSEAQSATAASQQPNTSEPQEASSTAEPKENESKGDSLQEKEENTTTLVLPELQAKSKPSTPSQEKEDANQSMNNSTTQQHQQGDTHTSFLPDADNSRPATSDAARRGTMERRPSSTNSLPRLVSTPTLTAPGEGNSASLAASLRKGDGNGSAPASPSAGGPGTVPKIDLQFGLWRDQWPKDIHGMICVDANLLVRYFRSLKKLDLVRLVVEERSSPNPQQQEGGKKTANTPTQGAAPAGQSPTPPPALSRPPLSSTTTQQQPQHPLADDNNNTANTTKPTTALHYRVDVLDSFWTSSMMNIGSLHHFVLDSNRGGGGGKGSSNSCVLCVADDMRRFVVFKVQNDKLEQLNASSLPLAASHVIPFSYRSLNYFLVYHQLSGEYGVLATATLANRGVPTLVSRGNFRPGWSDVVWKGTHHVRCTRQKFFCYNYNTGESMFECVYIRGASGSTSVCSAEHRQIATNKSPRKQSTSAGNGLDSSTNPGADPEATKSKEELVTVLNRKACLVVPMSVGGNFACLLYHHSSFDVNKASLQRRHSSGRMLGSAGNNSSRPNSEDGGGKNAVAEATSFVLRKRVFSHSEPWTHFCFLSDPQQDADAAVSMLCYSAESGEVWINRIFQQEENAEAPARDVHIDAQAIPRGTTPLGAGQGGAGGSRGLHRGHSTLTSRYGEIDVSSFALEQAHRKSPFERPLSGMGGEGGGTPSTIGLDGGGRETSSHSRRNRLQRTASGRHIKPSPSENGSLSPRRPRETSMERRARRRQESQSASRRNNQTTAQRLNGLPASTGNYRKDIEQVIRHLSVTEFHDDSPYEAAAIARLNNLAPSDPTVDRLLRSINRSPLRSASLNEDGEGGTDSQGRSFSMQYDENNSRSKGSARPNSERSARGELPTLAARGNTPLNYTITTNQDANNMTGGSNTARKPRPPSDRLYESYSPARSVREEDPNVTNLLQSLSSLQRRSDRRVPWRPVTPIGQQVPPPEDSPSAKFARSYDDKMHSLQGSRTHMKPEELERLAQANKRDAYQQNELQKSDNERLKSAVGTSEKCPPSQIEKTVQRLSVQDVEMRRKQTADREAERDRAVAAQVQVGVENSAILQSAEHERAIVDRLHDQQIALRAQHLQALTQKVYNQHPGKGDGSPTRKLTGPEMRSMALRLDDESVKKREKSLERILEQMDNETKVKKVAANPGSMGDVPLPRAHLEELGLRLYKNERRSVAPPAPQPQKAA